MMNGHQGGARHRQTPGPSNTVGDGTQRDRMRAKPPVRLAYTMARSAARASATSRPFDSIRSRSSTGVRVSTSAVLWGLTALRS